MDELFDVVDEFDRVVGRAPRSEVHRRSLMHRAVHIFAFDDRGRLWLQLRSARKDRCPLMWDSSASGHLGVRESYEACAIREVKEEIGLAIVPRYRFRINACVETDWEHVGVFTCRVNARIRYNPDEIATGEFFQLDTIAAWIDRAPGQFASAFVQVFRAIQLRGWIVRNP